MGQCPYGEVCVSSLWNDVIWTDVARNEKGYVVERAVLTVDGWSEWEVVARLPRNSEVFHDTTTDYGAPVAYQVSAWNQVGVGSTVIGLD